MNPSPSSLSLRNAIAFRRLTVAVVICLAAGCATNTGEKVKVTRAALSSIKHLNVAASAETPFQVRYSRDEAGSSGAMVGAMTFGLAGAIVGGSIEGAAKTSADSSKTKSLTDSVAELDGPQCLQNEVARRLASSGMFQSVTQPGVDGLSSAAPVDASLLLKLRSWGLRRHQAGGTNEMLQIGFDVNVRLVQPNGKVIWERDDFFLDGQGTTLDEFRDTPSLLVERLTAALGAYAGRVANELRYSE